MTEIHKISYIVPISNELLHAITGSRTTRPGHTEPPDPDEVKAYRAWKRKFKPLYDEGIQQGWFRDGGPDYAAEYQPPERQWIFDD